ncbi:Copper resistance protein A precursor [compost metagenome]
MQKRHFWSGCLFVIILWSACSTWAQKVVRYDLYIQDTTVTFTGKAKHAIAVNGQIPMPDLYFTEGDTAEIWVHNQLKESTSLHWHGLFLPNKEDGVPYLTQMPIAPGTTHVYRFPLIQNGTHWYHSHSGLQEQIGMYGSFIIHKREGDKTVRKGIDDLPVMPVILSEWTDMKPENVHRMLHNANDWFALRKNAVQSYAEAAQEGKLGVKFGNEWKRMLAMDVSDVYYDKVLLNGQTELQFGQFNQQKLKAGDKVRLRISNGGASSYFWLRYAGGKITVVATDGNDIEPVDVDRLIIAVSETYDIVLTIPQEGLSYELLATTEDRTQSASMYIGNGIRQLISPLPRLRYFEGMKMMNDMMKMNGDMKDMGMNMSLNQMDMNMVMYPEVMHAGGKSQQMDHSAHEGHGEQPMVKKPGIVTLNYAMMKATAPTTLPEGPLRTLTFELTGNMNRYVWSLDNKVVSETDKILIRKGENLRLVIYNNSMMRHPMHLHGHDFRVLNGQGTYAPLKNVIDIMPMETDTLEFHANAEGDWFFHCHILYHMMSGMGRIFSYTPATPNPLLPEPKKALRMLYMDDRMPHFMAENDFASNGNDGMFMLQNTRWSLGTEWRLGYNNMHGYETETHLGRYIGRMQWLMPFVGFDWRYRKMGHHEVERNLFGQTNTKDNRAMLSLGLQYTLPMLVQFQAEVYQDGNLRLQLMREDIPLAKRLRMSFMVNTDKEYMAGLRYIIHRNFALSAHYDSDMGFGAGLTLSY